MTLLQLAPALPRLLLPAAVAAFFAAFFAGSLVPAFVLPLVSCLAAIIAAVALPRMCLREPGVCLVVMVAMALIFWLAMATALSPVSTVASWWRPAMRCAGLALMIATIAAMGGFQKPLLHTATWTSISVVMVLIANAAAGYVGTAQTTSFGTGNLNGLMAMAGPVLIGAVVLVFSAPERIQSRWIILLLALGLLCLIVLAAANARRGLPLAWICALLAVMWTRMFTRWPRTAGLLALVGMAGAMIFLLSLFGDHVPMHRGERITMYRAVASAGIEAMPWGIGEYGTVRLGQFSTEEVRHFIATGNFTLHAHNDLLDLFLAGGIPAVIGCLSLVFLVAVRVWNIRDAVERQAAMAMATAIAVHSCTDNAYGSELGVAWLGVMIGMLYAAPASSTRMEHSVRRIAKFLPEPRMLALIFAIPAALAISKGISDILVSKKWPSQAVERTVRSSMNPESLLFFGIRQIDYYLAQGKPERALALGNALKKRVEASLPVVERLAKAQSACGDIDSAVSSMDLLIQMNPLHLDYLRARADLRALEIPVLARRWSMMKGNATLADLERPMQTCEEAADGLAAIGGLIERRAISDELIEALDRIAFRYGDVPSVAAMTIKLAAASDLDKMEHFGKLTRRLPGVLFYEVAHTLAQVRDPVQARRVMTFLRRFSPGSGLIATIELRRGSSQVVSDPLQSELLRLLQLSDVP